MNPISEYGGPAADAPGEGIAPPPRAPVRASVRGSVRAQARASVRASMHAGIIPEDEGGERRTARVFGNMVAASGQESKVGRMRAVSMAVNIREERIERDEDIESGSHRDEGEVPSLTEVVRALRPVLSSNAHLLALITIAGVALALVSSVAPQAVSDLYDGAQLYSMQDGQGDLAHVESTMTRYILIMSGQAVLLFADSFLERVVSVVMELDATRLVMSRLLRKHASFFDEYSAGELAERVYHDTDAVVSIFALHMPSLLCSVIKMVYGIVRCVIMDPAFFGVAMAGRPIQAANMLILAEIMTVRGRRMIDIQAEVLSALQDTISKVRRVIVSNGRVSAMWGYTRRIFDFQTYILGTSALSGMLGGARQLIDTISDMVFTWYGMREVMHGRMTIGGFIAFRMYSDMILGSMDEIMAAYSGIAGIIAQAHRAVSLILDTHNDEPLHSPPGMMMHGMDYRFWDDGARAVCVSKMYRDSDFASTKGALDVRVNALSFTYPSRIAPALCCVSLRVGRGELVNLVGPSGSGKSTLVSLLTRIYDAALTDGRVEVGGFDSREVCPMMYRLRVGVLPQEPVLFAMSILDNMTFGLYRAPSRSEVERAAALAGAHEMISAAPHGYGTMVGGAAGGVTLSPGQCQRVMLAATILRGYGLVILDEYTSALDIGTEREAADVVRAHIAGRATVIQVTHRMGIVKGTDRMVCLANGKLTDDGTVETLLHSCSEHARPIVEAFGRAS